MSDYPILNQQEAVKEFEATFLKDCGPDDLCQSELHLNITTNMPAKGSLTFPKSLVILTNITVALFLPCLGFAFSGF
jgi:hypothetical protein